MEQTMKKYSSYVHCCLTTGMDFAQHAMYNTLKMDKVGIKVNEAILFFYSVVGVFCRSSTTYQQGEI